MPQEHSFARADLLAGRARALGRALPSGAAEERERPVLRGAGARRGRGCPARLDGGARTETAGHALGGPDLRRRGRHVGADLARAAGEIDAARLLLERAAADADEGPPAPPAAARAQRDHALAVDLLLDAVNRLARTARARAQSESGDFQRFWRDANAAAGHVVLQWEPAARGYAVAVLDETGAPG
ncbi:hypothetical protein ACRAWF_43235 [Streptomyces sp. L7]